MKRIIIALIVILVGVTSITVLAEEAPEIQITVDSSKVYKDVPSNSWYKNSVDGVVSLGIMNGTSKTTFSPNEATTRSAIVTILWRMSNQPHVDVMRSPFLDVSMHNVEHSWFLKPVCWAHMSNIVNGTSKEYFSPNSAISREALATILYRYLEYIKIPYSSNNTKINSFEDADNVSTWAYKAMNWAIAEGIIGGSSDKNGNKYLYPQKSATRAEISTIILRFYKKYFYLKLSSYDTLEEKVNNIAKIKNTWDGSTDKSFASGMGTELAPYIIDKASQLAFLASTVNNGVTYEGKYFELLCDISLNNLPWTPIGTDKGKPFMGNFNGNNHTISDVDLTAAKLRKEELNDSYDEYDDEYISGLFGICKNATIQNLEIKNVTITADKTGTKYRYSNHYIGTLAAIVTGNKNIIISNVKISDVKTNFNTTVDTITYGSCIGQLWVQKDSNGLLRKITAQSTVDYILSDTTFYIGGIVGDTISEATLSINDINNNIRVSSSRKQGSYQNKGYNYCAAFCLMQNKQGDISFRNIFSKVYTNKTFNSSSNNYCFSTSSIVDEIKLRSEYKYSYENVFGNVYYTGTEYFTNKGSLWPFATIGTPINCEVVDELPQINNFNPKIWDISDLKNPTIKHK